MSNPPRKAYQNHLSNTVRDSRDDYPTPPGFVDSLLSLGLVPYDSRIWDPCAGSGWLVKRLRERGFKNVEYDDLFYNQTDFFDSERREVDWVVTNPPYKYTEGFVRGSVECASKGVAMLTNSAFLESVGRAEGLFRDLPPSLIAMNSRRMTLVNGSSSAFSHTWLIWDKEEGIGETKFTWVSPGTDKKERQIPTGDAGVWDNIDWSLL